MSGIAGRTNYSDWDAKTKALLAETEETDAAEQLEACRALGTDKYARSDAEASERKKATEAKEQKKKLDGYQQREIAVVQSLNNVLEGENKTVNITRETMEDGKRVLTLSDTTGPGTIHLTPDLSQITTLLPNTTLIPKSYPDDVHNPAIPDPKSTPIYGLIKVNLTQLQDCTVVVACKVLTGTLDLSYCRNVVLRLEHTTSISTIQADVCQNVTIEFHNAPSGKQDGKALKYWGADTDDRIYHAGVSNLTVKLYENNSLVHSLDDIDYVSLGAKAVGSATAEEVQFVTSVLDGKLVTEGIKGVTQGGGVPMTEREAKVAEERRAKVADVISTQMDKVLKVKGIDKATNQSSKTAGKIVKEPAELVPEDNDAQDVAALVTECEDQKLRGNESFGAGEYAQAVLYYTLALDTATKLPDMPAITARKQQTPASTNNSSKPEPATQLFPRHVTLSNRSACFLKLGHHEKALADGTEAELLNPHYVKGIFRRGLALHAMKQYQEAIPVLARALAIEPKNKQIKQALQFAEVRMQQEYRKRMEG